MINRVLIRIKVLQMLYSYMLSKKDAKKAEALKSLKQSMDKAYELYHYLLILPIELTHLQEQRLDNAKNKYLPDEEDLNPNMRFVENLLVGKLEGCEAMQDYIKDNPITWRDDDTYLRLTLDKIIASDLYKDYMAKEGEHNLTEDCEFWRELMKKVVLEDDNLAEVLEDKSVYWNDDLETVGTFALKTIRRFGDADYNELLPEFKDVEDQKFAETLYLNSIKNYDEYLQLIEKFVKKESWDIDRLAFMDTLILIIAITELEHVPSVPTVVTINEYIEIAKYYSTSKSGQFVNGVLNSIVVHLKKEGKLVKA